MNMLFIHKVRRPAIHTGDTVSFTCGRAGHDARAQLMVRLRVGQAIRRIGKVWDVQVVEDQKIMIWQVPREDLQIVVAISN